jgi:uncharacterized coiled-coil protein SlyX
MNIQQTTPKPDRAELHQASIDSLLTELRLARERIADLECDVTTYRILAASALEAVAQQTRRNKQLAERIDSLTAQIKTLVASPCLVCLRAGRTERAA